MEPNRSRSGLLTIPYRVVAPINVKGLTLSFMLRAFSPLSDDPGDEEVLHGRIEDLLDDTAEAVDLVDEQDVVGLELGQDRHHVAGTLDGRTRRRLDTHAHFCGHDVGEGGLAQPGRAMEQNVVERLAPLLCGLDGDLKVALDDVLTDIVPKTPGPQAGIQRGVFFLGLTRD